MFGNGITVDMIISKPFRFYPEKSKKIKKIDIYNYFSFLHINKYVCSKIVYS